MYHTNVTFENFDGEQVTKTLYFNLTKAEITKLQLSYKGGFDKYVQSVIDEKDPEKIMNLFEMLILKAYGVRNDDGFIKSKEKTDAFVTSEAYSELFMRLITDEKAQNEFFMGIMPRDLAEQAAKEIEKNKAALTDSAADVVPVSQN